MHKKQKTPFILSLFIGLILVAVFVFQVFLKSGNFSSLLLQFVLNKNIELKTNDDHINILLLGIGGGAHDGPNLTDTIILADIDEAKNKVTLTSIPRDLWIPDLDGTNKKINGAYQQGEDKRRGGGLSLSKAVVKKVTGQDVNYAVVIDFSGFVKTVDLLGGLDIAVDRTFDDYEYPIEGKEDDACGHTPDEISSLSAQLATSAATALDAFPCRYMHLHFDKGMQHMSGETALEFVRSRHADGIEGSDFARSQRQEKVIKAFRDKLLSAQTFINPAKMISLYTLAQGSINTDIKQNELDDFIKLVQKMRQANIQSAVIDAGDDVTKRAGLLVYAPINETYDYLSVLIPRIGNGNFSEIQKYISCEISKGNCAILKIPNTK